MLAEMMQIEERSVAELKPHPLSAEIFGQLPEDQFADLTEDIKLRKLRYPLELDVFGRVICGSQRLRAIKALAWDVVPCVVRTELGTEEEIREWLIRDNTLRRQLTPGQMYRAGVELERIRAAQAAARRAAQLKQNRDNPSGPDGDTGERGRTRDQVARELGTSGKTYERMKKVFESDDEALKAQVDQGLVSISAAAKRISSAPHQANRLPSGDERALPLRFAKWQMTMERFIRWLELNDPNKFDHLAPQTRGLLEELRDVVIAHLEELP